MSNFYSIITIGLKGKYLLSDPFDKLINTQLNYTCISIEYIESLVNRGSDPFNDIYLPAGLTKARFDSDNNQNIPVYTLRSSKGDVLMIPGINIISLPDVNGIKYSNVLLGISLSALPDTFDLATIKSELKDYIFDRIGVRSTIKTVVYGIPGTITQDQHKAIEEARKLNVINNKSNLRKIVDLQNQNSALLIKVKNMEEHIAKM